MEERGRRTTTEAMLAQKTPCYEGKIARDLEKAIVASIPSGAGGETGSIYSLGQDLNTSTCRHPSAVTHLVVCFQWSGGAGG